jgi:hypothetical protein
MRTLNLVCLLCLYLLSHANSLLAATWYVATTGSNLNTCLQAQSISTPKRTITNVDGEQGGLSCLLEPGGPHTLEIRSGTYEERIICSLDTPPCLVPSGSSWTSPTTIRGRAGETVILRPRDTGPPPDDSIDQYSVIYLTMSTSFVIFDNLHFDAINVNTNSAVYIEMPAHHIRISNSEIYHAPCNGLLLPSKDEPFVQAVELFNNNVHDNGHVNCGGSPLGHGLYIGTSDNLVDSNWVHNNWGYGIHVFSGSLAEPNNNIVRNNRVNNNTRSGPGGGITLDGDGSLVYNNLVYSNVCASSCSGAGIFNRFGRTPDSPPTNSKILNNTVWNNRGEGINAKGSGIIGNNIVYQNSPGTPIVNEGGAATLQTNLCEEAATCAPFTGNPSFVNAAGGNFHLQDGSPAIGAGTTRTEFTTDFENNTRPQGAAWDIGAYEFHTPPLP